MKTQSSEFLEYHYKGLHKGKREEIVTPFTSQNLLYYEKKQLWIGGTILGDNKVYMIKGKKTIPEFDSYYKLPYCSEDSKIVLSNSESDSISIDEEEDEEGSEIQFDKYSYFPDKFSHYSDNVIKFDQEKEILSYYVDNKTIRIIKKPEFKCLADQKYHYIVETEAKVQIVDYKMLSNDRIIVAGKHGFIGIYSFKDHNELLEYYDLPIEEFRIDNKEVTAFDIDEETERDIVVSFVSNKKENILTYFHVIEKEGIFKEQSVFRLNSTPFYSVKIGVKIGKFRIVGAITEGKPFKIYFYVFGNKSLVHVGQAELEYTSCYHQVVDNENKVISFGGIFDKIPVVRIEEKEIL